MKVEFLNRSESEIIACDYGAGIHKWVIANDNEELWVCDTDSFCEYALSSHVSRGCCWTKSRIGYLAKIIISREEYTFLVPSGIY